MKQIFMITALTVISFSLLAQQKEWKQMQDFHNVISKTYHPAEEGNLQPAKDSASVLLQKALAWQSSSIPSGYSAKEAKSTLAKLVSDCKNFQAAVVQKKNNKELKTLITTVHTTFHELMEKEEK